MGVLYPDPLRRPSRHAAIDLLRNAIINHGVRFIDTADTYCEGAHDTHYCERLIADCLVSLPEQVERTVVVATKGGMARTGGGQTSSSWRPRHDLTPARIRDTIRASRDALSTRRVNASNPPLDLWMMHHCDSYEPKGKEFASLLIAAKAAFESGDVLSLGLCNVSTDHVRAAKRILGDALVAVSNPYSLWDHTKADRPCPSVTGKRVAKSNKSGVVQLCQDEGLAFLAHAPLGGLRSRDGRRSLDESFPGLSAIARQIGVSTHVLALQWMMDCWTKNDSKSDRRSSTVIPLVGMRSEAHLPALGSLTREKENRGFPLSLDTIQTIAVMADAKKCGGKRKR